MSRSKVNLGETKTLLKTIADKVNNDDNDTFKIKNIDINLLTPSKENFYEIRDVDELAEDIKINGLYHNLVVTKTDDNKYEIISGERRYHALKKLGFDKVPCKIESIQEDDEKIEKLIQANYSARELNDYEKLLSIIKLYEVYENQKAKGKKVGKVRDKIGQSLGLSGGHVQKYRKINDYLISELKDLFKNNKITFRDCYEYCNLEKEQQLNIYNQLKENIDASKDEIRNIKKGIKESFISEKEKDNIQKADENKVIETVGASREDIQDPATNVKNKELISVQETNDTNIKPESDIETINENRLHSKLKIILNDLEKLTSEIKKDTNSITEDDKQKLISLHNSITEILNSYQN